MAEKIYLEGGGVLLEKEEPKDIDKVAIEQATNKDIFVLDLTRRNDSEKVEKYREFFKEYFKKLGGENVKFASTSSNEEIKKGIREAGILYVPGGDTEFLIENVNEKELGEVIKSFGGTIIGMSAGAYLMCNEYTKIREDKIDMIEALGVVNIRMKAHYEEKFDPQLIELSKDEDIYAVVDKSAIVVDKDGNLSFIGDVYLFSKGEKKKIN